MLIIGRVNYTKIITYTFTKKNLNQGFFTSNDINNVIQIGVGWLYAPFG